MPPMTSTTTVAVDLAKGALAGAAGVWVMDRVDWYMVEHGDQEAWRQTRAVRPDHKDPAHNMAAMAARAVGARPPPQPSAAGIAVHYAVGIGPAAVYGATRRHLPGGAVSRGLLFGLGMFLLEDEALNTAMGTAAPPRQYPRQAHARGLVAHLVLGLVTEAVLSALDGLGRNARPAGRAGAPSGGQGRTSRA